MGSLLTPIMADLYMDHLFNVCIDKMKRAGIIGIHKYVDDILIIGTRVGIERSQEILEEKARQDKLAYNDPGKIEFTIEFEDEYRSLSYLEVTLTGSLNNAVITNWYKKDIASDSMLNYFSNHPIAMKEEVMKEYVKRKLLTTNLIFREWTLHKVYRILINNS